MNRVVVVTGGTRGIGRSIAEKFHSLGDTVYVLFSTSEKEAKALNDRGILTIKCDVSSRSQLEEASSKIKEREGKVDVLVNNAGLWYLMPFEEFNEEKYRKMLEVNLNGVIYSTLSFLPLMKNRGGTIINIASNAGIGTAANGTTFYSVTKAGVIMLTKRLAFELGKYNIRVNAVAPGWIETDMTIGGKSEEEIQKLREYFQQRTVLHTTGKPEDIANFVVFLAGEESRYMTGQVLVPDGGRIDNLTHSI
ncbi:SDR family oxidoreductase [Acidianus sp. RZ1]|uniref:SDR family oxidoreductase n=1 Tax=Acidianus sp. RZ1 TaxID=1540082 RepID=UPI00149253C3|nr:SDR family oxidoreductase [Acidianus sp. RZ1]NON62950.1 SDR family oxidoreductase [Acidianus sp. RZ1]